MFLGIYIYLVAVWASVGPFTSLILLDFLLVPQTKTRYGELEEINSSQHNIPPAAASQLLWAILYYSLSCLSPVPFRFSSQFQ